MELDMGFMPILVSIFTIHHSIAYLLYRKMVRRKILEEFKNQR